MKPGKAVKWSLGGKKADTQEQGTGKGLKGLLQAMREKVHLSRKPQSKGHSTPVQGRSGIHDNTSASQEILASSNSSFLPKPDSGRPQSLPVGLPSPPNCLAPFASLGTATDDGIAQSVVKSTECRAKDASSTQSVDMASSSDRDVTDLASTVKPSACAGSHLGSAGGAHSAVRGHPDARDDHSTPSLLSQRRSPEASSFGEAGILVDPRQGIPSTADPTLRQGLPTILEPPANEPLAVQSAGGSPWVEYYNLIASVEHELQEAHDKLHGSTKSHRDDQHGDVKEVHYFLRKAYRHLNIRVEPLPQSFHESKFLHKFDQVNQPRMCEHFNEGRRRLRVALEGMKPGSVTKNSSLDSSVISFNRCFEAIGYNFLLRRRSSSRRARDGTSAPRPIPTVITPAVASPPATTTHATLHPGQPDTSSLLTGSPVSSRSVTSFCVADAAERARRRLSGGSSLSFRLSIHA